MLLDNLTGKIFGQLEVLRRGEDYITPKGQHKTQWWCICSCGRTPEFLVTSTHLKSGHTIRCLKCAKEAARKTLTKLNKYDLSGEYGRGCTSNTNKEFYFDLEDYDKIKNYGWREIKTGLKSNGKFNPYISTSSGMLLHRLIMNADVDKSVDHKNHNTFDNRKENLRICTILENNLNREPPRKETPGVYKKSNGRWEARIQYKRKVYCLGTFDTKEEAVKARKEKEDELFGEFSYDNSINS